MKAIGLSIASLLLFLATVVAQVPQLFNYQGRVAVGATNFEGNGLFRFSLINAAGTTTYWTNDGTGMNGNPPAAAVSLAVSKGLYSVLLGDTSLANMTAIPASIFSNADVRLRVWFNDGVRGVQLLAPDQRLAGVPYAAIAQSALAAPPSPWIVGPPPGFVMTSNRSYLLTSEGYTDLWLPANPQVGDFVKVKCVGARGFFEVITSGGNPGISVTTLPGAWVPQNTNLTVTFRAMVGSDSCDKLYGIVQNGGIYSSTDGGTTWVLRPAAGTTRNWSAIACSADGAKVVATVDGGRIYTSTDSGATWTERFGFNNTWKGITSSSDGTRLAAIRAFDPIYTSSDSGATWIQRGITSGQNNFSNKFWGAIAASSDGARIVLLTNTDTVGYEIFISTDYGLTWSGYVSPYLFHDAVCSSNGQILLAKSSAPVNRLLVSTSGGASWTVCSPNAAMRVLLSSDDGGKLVALDVGGQIWTSTDSGAAWAGSFTGSDPLPTNLAMSWDGSQLLAFGASGGAGASAKVGNVLSSLVAGEPGSMVELVHVGSGVWIKVDSTGSILAY